MVPPSLLVLIGLACTDPSPTDSSDPFDSSADDTDDGPDTARPPDTADSADTADTDDTDDGCAAAEGSHDADAYGGDVRADLGGTGAFRVEELCGRWWMVTPDGHPTLSLGVNTTQPAGSTDQVTGGNLYAETVADLYGSSDAWAEATVDRLATWGFNSAGAWSDTDSLLPHLPVAVNLDLSGDDWESGEVADYFDPAWAEAVEEKAATSVRPDDPNLVGYFLDNEVRWGPDWRSVDTLLQSYLELDASAPGKQEAVAYLLSDLGDLDAVNALLGTAFADEDALAAATEGWEALGYDADDEASGLVLGFLARVAERYFEVTVAAVRTHDPNHLVLGNREVSVMTREEVYLAQAALVDVISVNRYSYVEGLEEAALALSGGVDPGEDLAAIHALTGLPLLVTEFGYRADDAGLPNSWPPVYPTFDTQTERADAYQAQVETWMEAPWILGWHWYRWVDDPVNGRFDGEDNNWGLVSELDVPYDELVARTAEVAEATRSLLRVPTE